jgi:hypothetical protein
MAIYDGSPPVNGVKREVNRANTTAKGWVSVPSGLASESIFDSKQFPFAPFIGECLKSRSMRNRRRVWKIYKQYRELWQGMDERLEG